jgi:hypothetical protein
MLIIKMYKVELIQELFSLFGKNLFGFQKILFELDEFLMDLLLLSSKNEDMEKGRKKKIKQTGFDLFGEDFTGSRLLLSFAAAAAAFAESAKCIK